MHNLLHLLTPQPRYVRPRYQRIGLINHLNEWHWHWKRILLLAVLLFGEAGGLYMAYREGNWSAAIMASALVLYVLMCIAWKEMPLWTETGVRKRRNDVSRIWPDIKWPCYCELSMRREFTPFGGLVADDDVGRVARHVIGAYYIANPPGIIDYAYPGRKEFFSEIVDAMVSEKSDEYKDRLKQAIEDQYSHLMHTLDGTPTRRIRLRDGGS